MLGEDKRFHVYPSISPPYKWICYLEIESESGSKWVASGFKINIKPEVGHQVILTSAHCTYIGGDEFNPGALAKKITVYFPGQPPQVATAAAEQLWACPEYIQYKEEDKHRASQEEKCNASIDTKHTRGLWITPATMWITGGEIIHVTDERVFYKNDTTGGQSGSPVYTWYKGYWTAIAIHSYGGELNSGTRIRSEMIKKITEYLEVTYWGLL